MDYIKKADISFYGIDDELKNNSSSIFSTNTNFSQDYLTYEAKTYTDNQNNIQTSNISTSIYNYDTYVYTEPSRSNVSFASGEINYTSYDSTKFANFTTLFKNNPPWGVYLAEDWRGTTLFDISGNNRHATTAGNIYSSNLSGNGATAPITYLSGDSNATITWTAGSIPTNFTILGLTRYTGTTRNRILTDDAGFFIHGHWSSSRGVCYYGDGYKTSTATKGTITDWLCCIGKNSGTIPNNILLDGVASGVATNGTGNRTLGINTYTEDSEFGFACAMVWDKHLANSDMVLLNSLINDYKAGMVNPRLFFPVYDYKYPILKTIDGIPINPVVWYKFDDSANLGLDTIGNYNLTNNGSSDIDNNNYIKGSGSVSFDGSTKYLSSANFYSINNKSFSVSFWAFSGVANDTSTNQIVFSISEITSSQIGTNNFNYFQIGNLGGAWIAGNCTSPSVVNNSKKWVFITYTFDSTTSPKTEKLYINNILMTTITILQVNFNLTNNILNMGRRTLTNSRIWYNGNIDDFRIYDRVLTPAQANELYYGKYIDKSYPIIKRNNVALNPLVWYKFDNSTNLGYDEMRNHDLTNNNAVAFNSIDTTKGSGSASFNGTNQYLSKASAFNLNSKDFTISFWIKRTANNKEEWFVDIGTATTVRQRIYIGYISTNIIRYSFYSDDLDTPVYATDAGQWIHLAFTYKTGTKIKKIYKNGVEVASGTAGGELNTTNQFIIGLNYGFYYGGLMDDFRIYEYELSATEVQELYKGRVEVITTKTDRTLLSITNNSLAVSGSSIDINPVVNNNDYSYITFKNSGTLTLTQPLVCDILVIGGGGGGGRWMGGGGGAGGVVYQKNINLNNGSYSITIGTGGTGSTATTAFTGVVGGDGGDTFIRTGGSDLLLNGITFRGKGGGGGGDYGSQVNTGSGGGGRNGGSGGGGNAFEAPITGGTANQGNTFFNGTTNITGGYGGGSGGSARSGGGGGAGGIGGGGSGDQIMQGGIGIQIDITGNNVWYAGGGGGAKLYTANGLNNGIGGLGGSGVGGDGNASEDNTGDYNYIAPRHNGTANTGSGGGGGAYGQNSAPPSTGGGTGGSGVVILRFKNSNITDRTILWNDRTFENITYLLEAVPSTFTKRNSKKFKFTLNSSIKQLKLSPKAKLVIESVVIPNVLSQSFLQSKAINNVILKMKGILNHNNFDSSTKGSGNTVIFSVPIKLNSQGFSTTYEATSLPESVSASQKPRLNTDTGFLFINPEPEVLYNFDIDQNFIDDGEIEFTLIYDVGNVWKNNEVNNVYTNKPETLNFETDKQFLEGFNINFIIKDFDDSDNLVYSEKGLLNTINRNIF